MVLFLFKSDKTTIPSFVSALISKMEDLNKNILYNHLLAKLKLRFEETLYKGFI